MPYAARYFSRGGYYIASSGGGGGGGGVGVGVGVGPKTIPFYSHKFPLYLSGEIKFIINIASNKTNNELS